MMNGRNQIPDPGVTSPASHYNGNFPYFHKYPLNVNIGANPNTY